MFLERELPTRNLVLMKKRKKKEKEKDQKTQRGIPIVVLLSS